ncbi:hypothetical protein JAAARDRAFT_35548 [Jaapia argillacea MUCL 33604]|uniref:Uncharacterized protein n=1 Tax=Jaapia argillacea MUCL 33604 TaxID=933084 RepID=A0A067PSZ1_9AGAM|nr:hypothetical protein JAAARDRAFT_35548 [Jaapia argillacea MUCL 33604]
MAHLHRDRHIDIPCDHPRSHQRPPLPPRPPQGASSPSLSPPPRGEVEQPQPGYPDYPQPILIRTLRLREVLHHHHHLIFLLILRYIPPQFSPPPLHHHRNNPNDLHQHLRSNIIMVHLPFRFLSKDPDRSIKIYHLQTRRNSETMELPILRHILPQHNFPPLLQIHLRIILHQSLQSKTFRQSPRTIQANPAKVGRPLQTENPMQISHFRHDSRISHRQKTYTSKER